MSLLLAYNGSKLKYTGKNQRRFLPVTARDQKEKRKRKKKKSFSDRLTIIENKFSPTIAHTIIKIYI